MKLLCQGRELLPLFRKFYAWRVFRPSHFNYLTNSAFKSTLKCSESLYASLFLTLFFLFGRIKDETWCFLPPANLRRQVTATD